MSADSEVRPLELGGRISASLRKGTQVVLGPQGGLLFVILAIVFATEFKSTTMLHSANISQVLEATVVYFVGACAVTLIIVGGGLDLSVGAMIATGGIMVGALLNHGVPWPLAVAGAVVGGALIGTINATLVLKVLVPPFVTTLGMYFVLLGVINVTTGGNPLYDFPASFTNLGGGSVAGVPDLVLYGAVIGVFFHLLLSRTRFGYNVKAVGGNRNAALGTGVRVSRVTAATYIVGGATAVLAGVLLAAQNSAADPAAGGAVYTFQVFAAVIIGGTSLFGGTGTIYGTLLGSLLFSVLNNSLALWDVNTLWLNTITGFVLISAVAFDQTRRRRQFRASVE